VTQATAALRANFDTWLRDVDTPGTLEDTPRSIQSILADWRAAERALAAAEPGSAAAIEAQALVDTSKDAYRRASADALREQPDE
jgi:hypothetical protein